MPLRPIDATFVHPKRRLYVVYYRGALWQLPRMELSDKAWQNKKPYTDDNGGLYLSTNQVISDPILAQKLRTLDLPVAVHRSTLPRFEAWWATHGFTWLQDKIKTGESPLAAHRTKAADSHPSSVTTGVTISDGDKRQDIKSHGGNKQNAQGLAENDVFADMLSDLANEVLKQ
ncbi:hypothetical protein [Psychrobacter sp.]|uniref:hypothetical protein n=1 Tax=Psychrobacter sp. TaxID=56811 RepID=UPI00264727F7|nr:hypothetical protein [Psychrobacter sp.]MDN6275776.1 hypothetical protein [Psychrobacter sp.]MDN6307973.1 hypothetical protein [Psychrobacter sp.]